MSVIRDRFTIEILYKPSILNNITNLRVFNDDQHILCFIANAEIFKYVVLDDDEHDQSLQAEDSNKKCHLITKDVLSLYNLYDLQERFHKPRNNKTHSSTMTHALINLGIEKYLKFLNFSTCCTHQEWQAFVCLFKQYQDVFAWIYNDLKTYDMQVIQPIISIKEGVNPYQ